MNLFCFTLDGSTESIYEAACSQTLKEVLPRYQCSPALLRRRPERDGSDLSINSEQLQRAVRVRRNIRRSCVPPSVLDSETVDKDMSHACWKDLSHPIKAQNKESCTAACPSSVSTREDKVKQLNSDRTKTRPPLQGGESAADSAESTHTAGRLKKLQSLSQTKRGHASGKQKSTSEHDDNLANVLMNNNPVLTCISLGRKAEKKLHKSAASPQRQQQPANTASSSHEDSAEEAAWSSQLGNYQWSPFERSQPWTPFYHTCQLPQHELWVCGSTLSVPHMTEWDRFESLVKELDGKQTDLSPPPASHSSTDLQLSTNRQKSEQHDDSAKWRLQTSSHCDRKQVRPSAEKTLTNGNKQRGEAEKREVGGERSFAKGHRRSSNSVESLYSLNSGQSSSSGVTSGSDCSSNRDSLRLEDDLLSTREFCSRARVHTDYEPSPYDTESLKLKVGDIIDIIAKPHIGIWTGVLNGKMGNFKFIYVDVLTEEAPSAHDETQTYRARQKSTVQEVLKRLSLEEYSSLLQLNGYQTVDDLMRLREHHLTELNVTDPEHRLRLLAAVDSLQQLCSDSQSEYEANQEAETPSETMKADMNNCPRDSGCHMHADSPDSSAEDTHLHFLSDYPQPAETTAS